MNKKLKYFLILFVVNLLATQILFNLILGDPWWVAILFAIILQIASEIQSRLPRIFPRDPHEEIA